MNFSAVPETNLGQVTIEAVRQIGFYFVSDLPYSCVASKAANRVRKGGRMDEYGCTYWTSGERSQL